MNFRLKLLSVAAIGLCLSAGAAMADTASAKIALSNNYAGNSWRQAMLKRWEKVTGQALKDGVVAEASDSSIANGGYWICKNSWGKAFGYDGFFNIEYGACFTGVLLEWVDYNPDDFYWKTIAISQDIYSGIINKEIFFDAGLSYGGENSSILSYRWDFGDGNTSSGITTSDIPIL